MSFSQVVVHRMALWGSLVRFSHTVFALPFACVMLAVVSSSRPISVGTLLSILFALVSARTAAMTFNRIADRSFDARNPRTLMRELPSGAISLFEAWALLIVSVLIFLLASAFLGFHCLGLAPLVLIVLLGYSLSKRITSAAHLILGVSLSLAPGGVWYALTAQWAWEPLPLMAAVMMWVAGFDLLYACQDCEFDRGIGLRSIPAKIGIRWSFILARIFHLLSVVMLALFGFVFDLGMWYWAGVLIFAAIIASQHLIIRPTDLSRIDAAFFTRNGVASVVFFLFVLLDRYVG